MRDAIARAGAVAVARRRQRRCRPTTTRCCGASCSCSPTGASSASSASPGPSAQQAHVAALCDLLVRSALAQPHGRGAPRLDAAQPDGGRRRTPASSTSRTRCAARSATTSRRCCAMPSSRGTKSARSTGRCATGSRRARAGAAACADDFGEFWRAARMDGPAAPPEGAGHLLPPQAPRRQAGATAPTCRASSPMRTKVATRYAPLRGRCCR